MFMMKITEGRINTVRIISIETERCIPIIINRIYSFFLIQYFVSILFTKLVCNNRIVAILSLLSGTWKWISGRLKFKVIVWVVIIYYQILLCEYIQARTRNKLNDLNWQRCTNGNIFKMFDNILASRFSPSV